MFVAAGGSPLHFLEKNHPIFSLIMFQSFIASPCWIYSAEPSPSSHFLRHSIKYQRFHSHGYPNSWMVYFRENPIQIRMIGGVPLFQETAISMRNCHRKPLLRFFRISFSTRETLQFPPSVDDDRPKTAKKKILDF